jgi:hypothetical protein
MYDPSRLYIKAILFDCVFFIGRKLFVEELIAVHYRYRRLRKSTLLLPINLLNKTVRLENFRSKSTNFTKTGEFVPSDTEICKIFRTIIKITCGKIRRCNVGKRLAAIHATSLRELANKLKRLIPICFAVK